MQAISSIQRFLRDEEGVTAIEYGLIAALIALVIVVAVKLVGVNLLAVFNAVASCLSGGSCAISSGGGAGA